MIGVVENTLKFVARSAVRNMNLSMCAARFSTQKGKDGENDPETTNHQQAKEQSPSEPTPINKSTYLEKFNTLSNKIDSLNKQLEDHKDFEQTVSHYKALNKELSDGRNKITDLIEGGKKQWDISKAKIEGIESKNLTEFGKQLIKFNYKLKDLAAFKAKEEEGVLAEGIAMTSRILLNTLVKYNFKPYEPLKQKFDPKKHIKVGQGEAKKDAVVTKVVQPGWTYKDKVVEPAKVEL